MSAFSCALQPRGSRLWGHPGISRCIIKRTSSNYLWAGHIACETDKGQGASSADGDNAEYTSANGIRSIQLQGV